RGMIALPRRCSTAAPSRFIAASHTPVPTPARKSPTRTTRSSPVATPVTAVTRPTTFATANSGTAFEAPIRCPTMPESGSASSDPTAMKSSSRPICASVNPSESRTAGRRDAQVAKLKPLRKKTANTAQVARATARRSVRAVMRRSPRGGATGGFGGAVPRHGGGWRTTRRGRSGAGAAGGGGARGPGGGGRGAQRRDRTREGDAEEHRADDEHERVAGAHGLGGEPEQRGRGERGHRGERGDDGHAAGGAQRLVGGRGDPDGHRERRPEPPQHDADAREPEGRREAEEQQAGDRRGTRGAQHGDAPEAVDEPRAGEAHDGHRGDERAEHDGSDGLGLGEPVDDGERQPVVRRPLGERGREDDEADEQRAGLAPRGERG